MEIGNFLNFFCANTYEKFDHLSKKGYWHRLYL